MHLTVELILLFCSKGTGVNYYEQIVLRLDKNLYSMKFSLDYVVGISVFLGGC